MTTTNLLSLLSDQGWAVFPLVDAGPVDTARDSILMLLRELTGWSAITLETYHEYLDDDDTHFAVQKDIAAHARKHGFAKEILLGQLELFQAVLGPDICMTTTNNWRIARPNKTQDNIGFHRDIEVGHTAFELNLWFPLVDVDEASAMKVMSGSHQMSRERFPFNKVDHPAITRGSDMNKLGFMYATQIYDPWFKPQMMPVPMTVGQGLMFLTPVMHGQEVNLGSVTRWATDFVIANSLAPIDWVHHGEEPKYEIVTESPTMKVGKLFHDFPYKSS